MISDHHIRVAGEAQLIKTDQLREAMEASELLRALLLIYVHRGRRRMLPSAPAWSGTKAWTAIRLEEMELAPMRVILTCMAVTLALRKGMY